VGGKEVGTGADEGGAGERRWAETVSEFAPGDMAVIVPNRDDTLADRLLNLYGRVVVIICRDESAWDLLIYYQPYWRVSGVPSYVLGISHQSLRKIPPAPMDDDESTADGLSTTDDASDRSNKESRCPESIS
jgi:hypothetical protein